MFCSLNLIHLGHFTTFDCFRQTWYSGSLHCCCCVCWTLGLPHTLRCFCCAVLFSLISVQCSPPPPTWTASIQVVSVSQGLVLPLFTPLCCLLYCLLTVFAAYQPYSVLQRQGLYQGQCMFSCASPSLWCNSDRLWAHFLQGGTSISALHGCIPVDVEYCKYQQNGYCACGMQTLGIHAR